MLITTSVERVPVRLTHERWEHICRRYPEMDGQQDKVVETVYAPKEILKGDFGQKLAVRFYRRTPLTSKSLVVAYKEISSLDGFVVAAYFTRRPATWRESLWKR